MNITIKKIFLTIIFYLIFSGAALAMFIWFQLKEFDVYHMESLSSDILKALLFGIGPVFIPIIIIYLKRKKN